MNKVYSMKQVVALTGLQASNIRYYEQEGLIKGICRNHASVRQFVEKDVAWITFLAKLKDMEMPIAMMKEYASLRETGRQHHSGTYSITGVTQETAPWENGAVEKSYFTFRHKGGNLSQNGGETSWRMTDSQQGLKSYRK